MARAARSTSPIFFDLLPLPQRHRLDNQRRLLLCQLKASAASMRLRHGYILAHNYEHHRIAPLALRGLL